jgi:KDO2-lipid IV(A) lauroyltransferase
MPLWLRVMSRLPLSVLYALCGVLALLAHRVFRMRLKLASANVAACFPALDARAVNRILRDHYRQVGQMVAEIIRGAKLSRPEFLRHVRVVNIDMAHGLLDQGRPVLFIGAHQANWEWVLQALALQLGYPLDVGYKPIKSKSVDAAMNAIRRRFGARLVPAKDLLADLLQRRHIVRGICMLADQQPTTSEHKHWLQFLGRDTAFYMGPEQMARATRYAALFVALRRVRRGFYEMEFMPLAAAGENLEPGEFTTRYARLVEQEIRAAPSDWTWGHGRWKLKRSIYAD